MSIASSRQSAIVWRTSGWSGISRAPARFSAQASWSGKIAAIRSSASMRASGGGTFLPPRKRGKRQRDAGDPAPARHEHRRVEQRLDQHVAHGGRVQVALDVGEIEAVRRGQRQHDVVLGRGRLQLEIELAAEALAQRQTPGAVEPAAIGRVDDQLHAADFVEEALEDERVVGRQHAERGMRRRRDIRRSAAPPPRRCRAGGEPAAARSRSPTRPPRRVGLPPPLAGEGWLGLRGHAQASRDFGAQPRDRLRQLVACGRALRRARTGCWAAGPAASSTRTVPRSTRRMR